MTTYSSSSSSTRLSQGYDVFMSFRGEDTRTGFTSHLYKALTRKHIRTYKDDTSLEIGNFIAPELLEAIEASRFAVVILSSTFATSKWCLEEITKVVDCLERGTLIVIPVFYHVSPSDVRHQSGSFKQGFASHEANPEITPQKVETWRAAFARVGDISGLHVTSHRNESETVSEIVRKILKDMQVTLPTPFTDGLVGIDSRVHEVKRILIMESSDVRFIGICGMSGMGKTTLAEVVYKGIQNNFQGSCFIENIKDVSKKNDSTNLCKLQEKLLNDILKNNIHVESVTQGQTLLGTKLRGLRVIIVLDDVNHVDQLTFLAGSREWFGPGSRILVTTTNNDLLDSHIVDDIYTSEEMNGDEALRLFSQSAFKKEHPTHGYEKLSDDIVKLAGGLPLALNVYGSVLCGKEENYWKDMLEKLREYAHEEVLGRLETVYARLDRIQRNSFIYIACFLKGRNINLVKDILTNLRLYPECGISDLINKFLITVNHDDSVWVHDLLQQMCWEVLRKESERHDGKHIAIKLRRNVEDIFSLEPKGTRSIEIINQEPYEVEGADFFDDHNCFLKMTKLTFLRISKIGFHQGLHHLSNELRILEWYGCSLKSLPTTFNPQHIFELEMCYSQLETLWEKALDLPNLRSINLSFSKYLIKIPDLTSTSNLVKLNFEGCTNLTELHESVLLQKRVRYMNLKGCTRLRNLGTGTMEMEALEALLLSGCSNLEYLPEFGQNMKRLEHLFVDGTSIKKLPENLGNMFELRKLDVSETAIKKIPLSVHYLKRLRLLRAHRCPLSPPNRGFPFTNVKMLSSGLRELDLSYCNLSVVPDGIGLIHRLINLDLSGNDFVYLPASISLLSNLRMLCLNNCERLESLPKLSVVNEDTLYGLQIRFNYYISREGVNVSKFDVTGSNTGPMVSCLNCPKLVENGSGSCLTERILNSYLQLRTNYWITPEAVFEIVDAGSKIPSGFTLLKSDENVLLEGPWVGVAICAVINAPQTDAYMESKYVITVYIHVEGKCWPISVPINLLLAGLENHLVFYWTVADDLHRLVDSKQRNNFSFSFSVQPGDGNLLVTKFGVRFIRDEDILQLKRCKSSTIKELHSLIRATVSLPTDLQWYIHACEADTDLHSCHSIIHDLTSWMMQFILDYGKQQDSLDGVHKILKCLIEIKQQVLSECMEELKDSQLFPLVFDFYRICHGTSQLYNDFVRLLKDESYTWMSVKLALEQVVLKSRSDDYIYKETLQQLNDLEAADGVRFSDDFITSFAYICKQAVSFSRHFSKEIKDNKKFKLVMTLAKVSSITIACIFIIVATYIGNYKLLREMKDIDSYSMWLHIIQSFTSKSHKGFSETYMIRNFDGWFRLRISDFYDNAILLQDLKKKMAKSISITKENEGDVMAEIGKLETKIVKFSKTIENMSHQAYKYSHDIREVRITLNQIIADNNLHIRFCLIPGEDILQWRNMTTYSSSSSSTRLSQGYGYDVFMSFRGEDTRMGFTSHLYYALTRKHIRTYKDDKSLEIGNFTAPELIEALEASRFAVVILSSTFATSKWCLEEITKVVDCFERSTLIVIPVFYHVSPSDVRHQSGSFEQGFASHEANPEITPQKVETWRAAFARVGDISGLHVTPHRNEPETVSEIVRKILKGMQDTLPTA